MKTTTVPEMGFHIFIDNDSSSAEKYKACLVRKNEVENDKTEHVKSCCFFVFFFL